MCTTGNQPNSSGFPRDRQSGWGQGLRAAIPWNGNLERFLWFHDARTRTHSRGAPYRHETDCVLVSSWAEIASCRGGSYTFGIYAFMPVSGLAKSSWSHSHLLTSQLQCLSSASTFFSFLRFCEPTFFLPSIYILFSSTFDFFIALLLLRLIRPVLFTLKWFYTLSYGIHLPAEYRQDEVRDQCRSPHVAGRCRCPPRCREDAQAGAAQLSQVQTRGPS